MNPFDLFSQHRLIYHSAEAKLMFVACQRPADVVAALGLECGPEGSAAAGDVALPVAVLRSWEERFHAFLVGLTPGGLTLAVNAPPQGLEHALQVAAEIYAFATPEDGGRPNALRELAQQILLGSTSPQSSPHIWELGWVS
jgi:hypothetical protein